jgi:hypothetical protein
MAAGVAIVGAGMAGAACARYLADRGGFTVTLFDKGRSVGGRLAQRRAAGAVLDHGAQYIGVREPAFAELARAWCKAGLAAEWPAVRSGSGDPVLVGTPAMNAPVKALLAGLTVRTGTRVTAVRRRAGGWILSLDDGAEAAGFACLVVAVPAPQAAALLGRGLDPVRMAPCWSALVVPAAGLPGEAHRLDDPVLAWAARSDRKPGRGGPEAWTLHATPAGRARSWNRPRPRSRPPCCTASPTLPACPCRRRPTCRRTAGATRWSSGRSAVPTCGRLNRALAFAATGASARGSRPPGSPAARSGRRSRVERLAKRGGAR